MKFLQEIINPNSINLTNNQMGVLITVKISPTPEVAFENTNGSEASVYARNSLRTLGLLRVGGNKVVLTPSGEQVLTNYNLVDETGQMTEHGQNEYNDYLDNKTETDVPTDTTVPNEEPPL